MPGPSQSPPTRTSQSRLPAGTALPDFQWGIPPPLSVMPQRRPISTSSAAPPSASPSQRMRPGWLERVEGAYFRRGAQPSNGPLNIDNTEQQLAVPSSSRRAASSVNPLSPSELTFAPVWQAQEGSGIRNGVPRNLLAGTSDAFSSQGTRNPIREFALEQPFGTSGPSQRSVAAASSSTPPTNMETFERHQPRIISSKPRSPVESRTGSSKAKLNFLANTLPHHKSSPRNFVHPHLPSYLQSHPSGKSLALPTAFNPDDRHSNLTLAPSGLSVAFTAIGYGDDSDASAIRTTQPIPCNAGIYYYEVTVMDKGQLGFLSVGFSKRSVHLNRLVGWEPGSWGWHGDDGRSFEEIGEGVKFGPQYTTKDVVGAGICFATGRAFFTKNGELIGHTFRNLDKVTPVDPLYPSVGLRSPREVLRANFTGPFVFDIDNYYNTFRDGYFKSVIRHPIPPHIAALAPSATRSQEDQNLRNVLPSFISDYLKHNGFSNVSHRFDTERERRAMVQGRSEETRAVDLDTSESLNYVLRLVHDLIVIDEIQEATRIVRSRYPDVLAKECEQGKWGFWMDALAFIRILRELERLSAVEMRPDDEDMEVDGLLTSPSSGSTGSSTSTGKRKRAGSEADLSPIKKIDTEPKDLLDEAIKLGADIRDQWTPSENLPSAELFTLFGKSNIDEVLEVQTDLHIASKERRAWVADGLVRAIRALQGVPTSTNLEQIYRRAAGAVSLLRSTGDAHAAFADVRWVIDGKPPA